MSPLWWGRRWWSHHYTQHWYWDKNCWTVFNFRVNQLKWQGWQVRILMSSVWVPLCWVFTGEWYGALQGCQVKFERFPTGMEFIRNYFNAIHPPRMQYHTTVRLLNHVQCKCWTWLSKETVVLDCMSEKENAIWNCKDQFASKLSSKGNSHIWLSSVTYCRYWSANNHLIKASEKRCSEILGLPHHS